MYKKEYTIRWSEIDPNIHLTSSAYIKYITDTRMNFFEESGFGMNEMRKGLVGPIVLTEKSYFFKEVHPGERVIVGITNAGMTEDFKFVKLEQRMFNAKGENNFLGYTVIAFMDAVQRKLTEAPSILCEAFNSLEKSEQFRIYKKEEFRDEDASPILLKD
jgi:acyl-CoA thioester hydrolase